jgi:uncharacterized protein involved in exopolysaccharide biosynthesis
MARFQGITLSVICVLMALPAFAQGQQPRSAQDSTVALSAQQLKSQIEDIQSNLIDLRKTYKDSFPGIRALKIQLQTLQDQRDALAK